MRTLFALALAAALGAPLRQPQRSLLQAAREHGGTAGSTWDVLLPNLTVEDLVPESSTILRAQILSVSVRLSADEANVITEYDLAPLQFYRGSVPTTSRPGRAERFVVSHLGGTMTVDGLTVSTVINVYPKDDPLRTGDQIIVFMQPQTTASTGRLGVEPLAMFRVRNGLVSGWTGNVRSIRNAQALPLKDFETRLAQAGVRW